jgi:PAS domain S-box-containing protein
LPACVFGGNADRFFRKDTPNTSPEFFEMKTPTLLNILVLTFVIAAAPLAARPSVYDSVRASTASQPLQTRFDAMEYFADSLLDPDPQLAMVFTEEAIRLARELGNKNEEGYLLNSLSRAYLSLGQFDKSGEYSRQALKLNLEIKHEFEIARSYKITAITYNYMGLYTNAMEYSLRAQQIFERIHETNQAAVMLNSIGTIYLRLARYDEAKQFFDRAFTMIQRKDTTRFKMLVLNNIASVYYHQGRSDTALRVLMPLLARADRTRDRGTAAYTMYNIGSAYGKKKEYGLALSWLRQARTASAAIHEAHGEVEAMLRIVQVYASSGRTTDVLAALHEAIPRCRHEKTYDLLHEALELQRTTYEKLGDIRQAYHSLKEHCELTDSIFTISEKFGVATAVFSSDLTQKENEINRLRQEAALNEVSIEKKEYQIYALAALMLIVIGAAIALIFMYRKASRLHRIELEQKEKIEALFDELSNVVSERRHADEQTRELQRKFQSVWEKSVDGMRLTDPNGNMLMVNEAFCRMVGMDREALTGKPLSVIYDEQNHEAVVRVYRERFAARILEKYFERELVLRDGHSIWFEVTNTYLEFDDQPPLLLGIFRDISHRKRLEHQLVQSQKLEGIGTLAGGIAHDFNNLLAMILGSAEMLQRQLFNQPQMQKYVDRIVEASTRGTSISRQLLIFSRPDEVELKPISLSKTVGELQDMLRHFLPKTIHIHIDIEAANDLVMGDAGQIHQALLNLALNAGDAMSNRGTITIREFIAAPHDIKNTVPLNDAQQYIALSVADTGIGMDETLMQKIFDPFFTTKERHKGTGLGLSSVHGIVKNHGGSVNVESTPGTGTTITLYFPLVTKPVSMPACEKIPQEPGGTATILLVDDEVMIRETLSEFLQMCGYTVHAASGGNEALELFRRHHETLDLVVTDLGMPEMGGEELFKHLQSIDPEVKVIVSSGYLDGTTKSELLNLGVKAVLTKPVKVQDLQAAIRTVLSVSGFTDAHPADISAD